MKFDDREAAASIPMDLQAEPMAEYLFSLNGIGIKYVTASPRLKDPVLELLKAFKRDSSPLPISLTLCFHVWQDRADIPWRQSTSARQLTVQAATLTSDRPAASLSYEVIRDGEYLIVDFHEVGVLVINAVEGRVDGHLVKPELMHVNFIEYLFCTGLFQLLRCRGLYSIHAGALEKDGHGILIPGRSGRGKTTSLVSLLRAGYRYLSDDHPLVRDAGTHVEVCPFPTKINVTNQSVGFFPELQDAPDHVLHTSFPKQSLDAETFYSTGIGACCPVDVILFPNVIDAQQSDLEPLPKSRALELLLPHALLVYDPNVARREFQVLAKLVQQVDSYYLHFGRDVLELPKLITPLLES